MSVVIIDYEMGNVASVQKALNFLKIPNQITNEIETIKEAKFLILPGVGSFAQGMNNLNKLGLTEVIKKEVLQNKKNFLGICVGLQLIASKGYEPYECNGLNLIEGEVKKIELIDKKIPHLGWNNIKVINPNYFENLNEKDFYFIHSYHFIPKNPMHIAATVNYGIEMTAALQHENIFAVQFHPEKSQEVGLSLLNQYFQKNA